MFCSYVFILLRRIYYLAVEWLHKQRLFKYTGCEQSANFPDQAEPNSKECRHRQESPCWWEIRTWVFEAWPSTSFSVDSRKLGYGAWTNHLWSRRSQESPTFGTRSMAPSVTRSRSLSMGWRRREFRPRWLDRAWDFFTVIHNLKGL